MLRQLARHVSGRLLSGSVFEEAEIALRLLDRPNGTLVEVGAHQGDHVFGQFVDRGWDVHAFEPDPQNRRALEQAFGDRPNVVIVPKAVSDSPGELTLYTSDESTGISSLTAFTPGHVPSGTVEVVALRDYLREAVVHQVDFLKMDVEGHEKFVLDGFPWDTHRPEMVLLEFEDRKTCGLGYSWRDLADTLEGLGYGVLVSEWYPIERYGVTHSWRRLERFPTALADINAWGNLIAVDPGRIDEAHQLGNAIARRAQRRARRGRVISRLRRR
jgi:FkbM family methyltransferase